VDELLERVVADLELVPGEQVEVLVNGLGATPVEELYIMYRRCVANLSDRGLTVRRPWIGEYGTSMEMAGASISLLRVDPESIGLLDAPTVAPMMDRR
jgi:dihydroxyacetone kinase-like protein